MNYDDILTKTLSATSVSKTAEQIPSELKAPRQWVCWKKESVDGKSKKVPVNPKNGRNASPIDRSTWSNFDSALVASANYDGIGFFFTEADEFVGIDLDNVLDPETGELDPEASRIVNLLDSYTEISQSGRGIHIIAKGKLDGSGKHKGVVEIYDRKRYFCMTGRWFANSPAPIRACQPEIDEIYGGLCPKPDNAEPSGPYPPSEKPGQQKLQPSALRRKLETNDKKLLARACKAGNGEKFRRLYYRGDWNGEYPSPSEADQALCAMLAFWCHHDESRVDRLFRNSKLYRPKWNQFRGELTYGQITVHKAVEDHLKFLQQIAVNQNEQPIELFVSELLKAIDLCPWKGKSGATDLQVLKAHLAIILESRQLIHHAGVRTIADKAGIQSINTISSSHSRLKKRGWLTIVGIHRKGTPQANTYELTIPTDLTNILRTTLSLPTPPNCVLECSSDERSLNLWTSSKGLGKTKQKIFEQLDELKGQTVNELARRNWVRPTTMRKHLRTLASFGLAYYDSGLWYLGDKEPEGVAEQLGISGTLERQKVFHQEQREARNHLLWNQSGSHDTNKVILKPDLIEGTLDTKANEPGSSAEELSTTIQPGE